MRFIVNNKIYDTEKSELLCAFQKRWEAKFIWGEMYPLRDTNLYKTAKGAYFLTCKEDYDIPCIEVINEDKAKEYLMYHNYDKYAEMFGELEEA